MKFKSIEGFEKSLHGETLEYCENHGITPSNRWGKNDKVIEPWKTARAIFELKQNERDGVLGELEKFANEMREYHYVNSFSLGRVKSFEDIIDKIKSMRGGNNENE